VRALAPEAILVNGNVRTLEAASPRVSALAVGQGRIWAVGSSAEISAAFAGPSVRRVDLGGATVLPGFIDAHVHLENGEGYDRTLTGVTGRAAVLAALGQAVAAERRDEPSLVFKSAARPDGEWVRRADLDGVDRVRPVAVAYGPEALALNSPALDLLGLSGAGGDRWSQAAVERDGRGSPTGVVRGRMAKMMLRVVAGYDLAYAERALLRGMSILARAGITGVHHIVKDRLPVIAHQRLRASGRPVLRVGIIVRGYEAETTLAAVDNLGLLPGLGDEQLQLQGVKVSVDGYLAGHGAAFTADYADRPGCCGTTRIDQDQLNDFVRTAHRLGTRCCIHTNGDRAVDMALTAYARALAERPRADHRHRLEHVGNLWLRPDQLARIASLGLVAVPNPPAFLDRSWMITGRLGPDRSAHPLNVADMLDAGIPVVAASDFPGQTPADPLAGIGAMVTRRDGSGVVRAAGQAITVEQAVRCYTAAPAWAGFAETRSGAVAPGMLADLTVLERDPFAVPAAEIAGIGVLGTVVGGRAVWADGSSAVGELG
jgi:hypothetical protein